MTLIHVVWFVNTELPNVVYIGNISVHFIWKARSHFECYYL